MKIVVEFFHSKLLASTVRHVEEVHAPADLARVATTFKERPNATVVLMIGPGALDWNDLALVKGVAAEAEDHFIDLSVVTPDGIAGTLTTRSASPRRPCHCPHLKRRPRFRPPRSAVSSKLDAIQVRGVVEEDELWCDPVFGDLDYADTEVRIPPSLGRGARVEQDRLSRPIDGLWLCPNTTRSSPGLASALAVSSAVLP